MTTVTGITLFKAEFFRALARNDAFNHVLADLYDDMSHDVSEPDLRDFSD